VDNYTSLDKVLHRLVLHSEFIAEVFFDVERRLNRSANPTPQRNVFVAGLARAGTTTLMRALHASGEFASLSYRDMPFVMAPNLWRHIAERFAKPSRQMERAHGDGILVDFDSPEAFEEVFWRVFYGKEYIRETSLHPHRVSADIWTKYREYLALICQRYDKTRYLSKNNNHILRLRDLAATMSDSLVLIPFRDPIQQAHSLLHQHQRFLSSDRFTQDYMGWLCHFEFGATHRPFRVSENTKRFTDPMKVHYWLELWIEVYDYLLHATAGLPNVVFVCYESLCAEPSYWKKIQAVAQLQAKVGSAAEFRLSSKEVTSSIASELSDKALRVYDKCMEHDVRNNESVAALHLG
jgi:hypothetical protein